MNKQKYIVITGASSGIGKEIALQFAKMNKNLVIVARRENKLKKLKEEILKINKELDVRIVAVDLTIIEKVYEFYESLHNLDIQVFINNAGFGNFDKISNQNLNKVTKMLHLNIEALTILSILYVKDYKDIKGSQLINVSSTGGYTLVGEAIPYCASKFYVSTFTEGIDQELKLNDFKLRAKVLAPSATETEFAQVAKDIEEFTYEGKYHTAQEMAKFTIDLYNSDKPLGIVDLSDFKFKLKDYTFSFRKTSSTTGK